MKKCVALFSGGLDSSTVLAIAKEQGFDVYALTVAYGQRHSAELRAAENVVKQLRIAHHRTVSVDLAQFGGSALTAELNVPKDRSERDMARDIPVTYVPARNTVLLSLALAYAETLSASDIFLGVNAVDYSGYPDCRPEFVSAFETLANLATKAGVEGSRMTIHAPLIAMSKAAIIEEGLSLGVDYSLTHSCYDPVESKPCGRCDACLIRISAFASLGLQDPALGAPSQA